jgi:L-ascorbate metabolism protein UlaG (beta-lactamase superfamily)
VGSLAGPAGRRRAALPRPAADNLDTSGRAYLAGAAQTALVPGGYLTLTSAAAAEATRLLGARAVVPLHFEGWAHFTEGRAALAAAFDRAGLADRLHLPAPGEPVEL